IVRTAYTGKGSPFKSINDMSFAQRRRRILWGALSAVFLMTFPLTVLSAALPVLALEFSVSTELVSWVITAPMFCSAVAMPGLGVLSDRLGHRRAFLASASLALIATLLTPLSGNIFTLIGL